GLFIAPLILCPLEMHPFEVLFECSVGFCIGQNADINDDVDIACASMRGHAGRTGSHEIARCEAAHEVDRIFPWPQATQQGHEDAFACLGYSGSVADDCL